MHEPILSTVPADATIRMLRPSEMARFRDHLLRLDRNARRDRFNGGLSDDFVGRYAERCFVTGATVVGCIVGKDIVGAAELHELPGEAEATAEIAFSVEPEHQRDGLGTALFERLMLCALSLGYRSLRVTTGSDNLPMKRLALKFGAELQFRSGEAVGQILLDRGGSGAGRRAVAAVPEWLVAASKPWLEQPRAWHKHRPGRR